ncbi:MAG: hypothetical protein HC876_06615 [Chloroflexaceae bacterium]|nr:hypothetical protein [Chloroflexaceae bacterium]
MAVLCITSMKRLHICVSAGYSEVVVLQFRGDHILFRAYGVHIIGVALVILLGFLDVNQHGFCSAQEIECDVVTTGRQLDPATLASTFDVAALGTIGVGNAPEQPMTIRRGRGDEATFVRAYVPCVLVKSHGAVESEQTRGALIFNGWKQFNAPPGFEGETVVNTDAGLCAYGIMQLIDGMNADRPWPPGGGFSPQRVAGQSSYNIAAGVKLLIHKWNNIPQVVGENDPYVVEDWYFASWAYFGLTEADNPTDPRFPPNRGDWQCAQDPTQQRINWPYQELVWGCARNPPRIGTTNTPLWTAVPLTLPDRGLFANGIPNEIPRPLPAHGSCRLDVVYLPLIRR